jgi:LmbE family N-acetylglucosaminyl deacetylase
MKRLLMVSAASLIGLLGTVAKAQTAAPMQTVKGPDERFKTDILLVVAHPDDEGGVTPYLARAIYDQHKRVAVVYLTRGGSGGNDYAREHGPALADIREQEARQACAKLGISNVWFLAGKDTASQNVLNSLANWGHGANLEALVRIVRLTKPEVVITWLPGAFIGENHGDHQAAGVLATEAFDMAGEPTAFPSQVAGATKRLEQYLENLTPWQPKKLYFFSDADNQKQFEGSGPAYSIKELSPAEKKPYWRLALDAAAKHLTQFPESFSLARMSDAELEKMMNDPKSAWWPEPMTLIFGKAAVGGAKTRTSDVFATAAETSESTKGVTSNSQRYPGPLDGPIGISGLWAYYEKFRMAHGLSAWSNPSVPEIAVKSGSIVSVPFYLLPAPGAVRTITISTDVPDGWKVVGGEGALRLDSSYPNDLRVDVQTPELKKEDFKTVQPRQIVVRASSDGRTIGEVRLNVLLKASALPQ